MKYFSSMSEQIIIIGMKIRFESFSSYLGIYHPTTECFQMRQRCLKRFSFRFRSLFGLFEAGRKATYLFGCVRGTLDNVCKVLAGFSVSSQNVSTLMGPDEISRTWNGRVFIRSIGNLGYVLSL